MNFGFGFPLYVLNLSDVFISTFLLLHKLDIYDKYLMMGILLSVFSDSHSYSRQNLCFDDININLISMFEEFA